jgi:hypothetical protein
MFLTQLDNDFLIGIAYDTENAIDAFSRNLGCERFKYLHRDWSAPLGLDSFMRRF